MFATIINGEKPAQLFRRLMNDDPSLSNRRLATLFYEEFPNVDSVAVQHIWYWKSPRRPSGTWSDEYLDKHLCELLAAAGYFDANK